MKKIFLPMLLSVFILTSCGQEPHEEENIVFGDIDTTKEYVKNDYQAPSAVPRKEEVNIKDTFTKIPIVITEEIKTGKLPTLAGDKYDIERVQLNGVYFDINQIANKTEYNMEISDGILHLSIPRENGTTITSKIAQIADATYLTDDKQLDESEYDEVIQISQEYADIYAQTENQASDEYGNYYTYEKYVNWLSENEKAKFNITMYSPQQILNWALELFKLDKDVGDFYVNTSPDLSEASDWYRVVLSYRYEMQGEDTIEIAVKQCPDGIFLIMTQYAAGENIDENGELYFTPTMIINIAQNNYFQLAQDSKSKVYRENYQNGLGE